ncbi:hypothetical protein Syun_021017 [Stephania yunnanensis]|uniref:Glycosyl-hydrolase family 116 N-terminal domain-containing protein n=1 Tax=Stephania yunnanensis TaxID=152371 RepID=A0AAP0NQM8_9MAGN
MGSLLLTMSMLTPGLGGRLGGYSGGGELGGGYGGFGGGGLGAYRDKGVKIIKEKIALMSWFFTPLIIRRMEQILYTSVVHIPNYVVLCEAMLLSLDCLHDRSLFCFNFPGYKELEHQVSLIRDVSKKVFSKMGTSIGYEIGTMIEIPRAALVAGREPSTSRPGKEKIKIIAETVEDVTIPGDEERRSGALEEAIPERKLKILPCYSLSILFTKPCPTRTPLLSDSSSSSHLCSVVVLTPLLSSSRLCSVVFLTPLLPGRPNASAPSSSSPSRLCSLVVLALLCSLVALPCSGRRRVVLAPIVLFFDPALSLLSALTSCSHSVPSSTSLSLSHCALIHSAPRCVSLIFISRDGGNKKYASVLALGQLEGLGKPDDHGISSWGWNLSGQHSTYHALFPRAWTIYDGDGVGPMVVFSNYSNGSETKSNNSVFDPLLIRDGSETELVHSVSDPFLISNGSEMELLLSVSDPSLISNGSEMELLLSIFDPNGITFPLLIESASTILEMEFIPALASLPLPLSQEGASTRGPEVKGDGMDDTGATPMTIGGGGAVLGTTTLGRQSDGIAQSYGITETHQKAIQDLTTTHDRRLADIA